HKAAAAGWEWNQSLNRQHAATFHKTAATGRSIRSQWHAAGRLLRFAVALLTPLPETIENLVLTFENRADQAAGILVGDSLVFQQILGQLLDNETPRLPFELVCKPYLQPFQIR